VWRGGTAGEEELLDLAYRTALTLAAEHGCYSVALPALSAGAYGYPLDDAGRVAINAAVRFLEQLTQESPLQLVRFVLFSPDVFTALVRAMESRPPVG
jgi:O-acetyl-ADP-ribose deacetylase (regulator of RNase III)